MPQTINQRRALARLRKDYRRAYKMKRLTRQRGWQKAVARLNAAIMQLLAKPA